VKFVAVGALLLGTGFLMGTTHPNKSLASPMEAVGERAMATGDANGIVRLESHHSVDETVKKLTEILQTKGVKLFMVVDHSGEAEKAGLKMPNTKLVIFGNPKGGTPVMLAAPSVAIDLPLKILVAEDGAGKTWVSYNAPGYLQERHKIPAELVGNLAVIEQLAAKIVE
jgi:uncharacterized protein (DUF302 family)